MPDENGNLLPGEEGYVVTEPTTPEVPLEVEETPQIITPETPQEPGQQPDPPKGVTDQDFKAHNEDANTFPIHAEQTVEKAGRPAGFNPFYHGDHVPHDGNPLLQHLDSETYEKNKNRENR